MLEYHFSMNNLVQYSVDEILNYGCWCQLENPDLYQYHKGPPVDNIDRKCQNRKRCHKCITMGRGYFCWRITKLSIQTRRGHATHLLKSTKRTMTLLARNSSVNQLLTSALITHVNVMSISLTHSFSRFMKWTTIMWTRMVGTPPSSVMRILLPGKF